MMNRKNIMRTAVIPITIMYLAVIIILLVNGLENKDIAALLNISEETVRQRLSRGKKMLEEKLEDMEKQHGTD